MNICGFIGPQEIVIILILVPLFFIFPIIALVDVLRNEYTGNNKLIWVLVILLSGIVGALIYFSIGRNQKIGKQ